MMNLQGEARSGPSRPSGAPLPTGGRADEASADVGAHGRAPVAGTSSSVLRICLFGPLRVCMGERVLIDEHFARWKAKALFVYLYLNRGHHVSKDEALDAKSFPPTRIPWEDLAFRSAHDAIRDYIAHYF